MGAICPQQLGNPGCFLIPAVVGIDSTQILVTNQIELDEPAIMINSVDTMVNVTSCTVCTNRVIFNAIVTKNITYKTAGRVDTINDDVTLVSGKLRHATFFVPVSGFVEIEGADPATDQCCVEFAGLEPSCQVIEPVNVDDDGTFQMVIDKEIILFTIKVLRPTQVTLNLVTGDGFACPGATEEQAAAGRIPSQCLPVGPIALPEAQTYKR
ncbi:MAG: DUF3794 domain-containing protein [Firmicutes bacterium]|nr:DUF3794 domain-containing protein [Bacillota bacterium]